MQVRNELTAGRLAIEQQQLLGHGRHDGCLRQVLAGEGNIRERARLLIEIPLAGSVERLGNVLDKVANAAPQ